MLRRRRRAFPRGGAAGVGGGVARPMIGRGLAARPGQLGPEFAVEVASLGRRGGGRGCARTRLPGRRGRGCRAARARLCRVDELVRRLVRLVPCPGAGRGALRGCGRRWRPRRPVARRRPRGSWRRANRRCNRRACRRSGSGGRRRAHGCRGGSTRRRRGRLGRHASFGRHAHAGHAGRRRRGHDVGGGGGHRPAGGLLHAPRHGRHAGQRAITLRRRPGCCHVRHFFWEVKEATWGFDKSEHGRVACTGPGRSAIAAGLKQGRLSPNFTAVSSVVLVARRRR